MTVQDLNDNDPRLNLPDSQVVKVDLPAGSVIYSVFATDPDYDINGTNGLAYSVTGNSNFEMDGNDLKNKYAALLLIFIRFNNSGDSCSISSFVHHSFLCSLLQVECSVVSALLCYQHASRFYMFFIQFLSLIKYILKSVQVGVVKGLLATKFTLQLFGIRRFTMSYSVVL